MGPNCTWYTFLAIPKGKKNTISTVIFQCTPTTISRNPSKQYHWNTSPNPIPTSHQHSTTVSPTFPIHLLQSINIPNIILIRTSPRQLSQFPSLVDSATAITPMELTLNPSTTLEALTSLVCPDSLRTPDMDTITPLQALILIVEAPTIVQTISLTNHSTTSSNHHIPVKEGRSIPKPQ